MTYAIFTVMYGVPLSSDTTSRSELIEDLIEIDPTGLHAMYSGCASENPAGFGVVLDAFDEAGHHVELSALKLIPTAEQIEEYNHLFSTLSEEFQGAVKEYGNPRVFFLISTS